MSSLLLYEKAETQFASQWITSVGLATVLVSATCPGVTRGVRMGGTQVHRCSRHHFLWHGTGSSMPCLSWWFIGLARGRGIVATSARAPVASMHMHACHGALACDPLSWARVFLFDTFTFPNVVPLASTIGHWNSGVALGSSQMRWANVGVKCRTSAAGHVRTHYGQLYC